VTVRQGIGIKKLCDFILGKTIVFCGESGVGKTSLLRALLKSDVGRVGDVNPFTGKGRHTTTGAILLGGPSASRWIDTPGVREFGIANISPSQLAHYFPEFREVSCAQSGCLHQDESGCQVQSLARYESYRKILDSLIK
jgi:ribosome biogenesis GTPase